MCCMDAEGRRLRLRVRVPAKLAALQLMSGSVYATTSDSRFAPNSSPNCSDAERAPMHIPLLCESSVTAGVYDFNCRRHPTAITHTHPIVNNLITVLAHHHASIVIIIIIIQILTAVHVQDNIYSAGWYV